MDTGDLTSKTYKAIMIEAERFHHDLTLQYGLLSYERKNEIDFIKVSLELTHEMMEYDENDLEDMFFGSPPGKYEFHDALKKILANISALSR